MQTSTDHTALAAPVAVSEAKRPSPSPRSQSVIRPIMAIASVSLFVVHMVCAIILAEVAMRAADRQNEERVATLLKTSVRLLAAPLWNMNYEIVTAQLDEILQSQSLADASVYDDTGAVVARRTARPHDTPKVTRSAPIYFHNGNISSKAGHIEFTLSRAEAIRGYWRTLQSTIAIAVVAMLAIMVTLALTLQEYIGQPLAKLGHAVEKSRLDGSRHLVDWHRPDEFGAVIHAFNEMQKAAAENSGALIAANQRFHDALSSMGHGLSMFDADGRFVVANDAFIRMYHLEDLDPKPGMPFEKFMAFYNERQLFKTPISQSKAGRPRHGKRREHEMTDGRLIAVSRFDRPAGGWVMLHEDITQQQRLRVEREKAEAEAATLREQELKAESESRAKSDFLATMSHEIRTPMNAVIGLATTLLETKLDTEQRAMTQAIEGAGNNLLHLLNDILDLSKLDAEKMEFESLPFSPAMLVSETVSIAGVSAAKKSITLHTDLDPSLPETLTDDPGRIRQVILNLATNAVKFTQAGSVTVGARLLAQSGPDALVEWWVSDTGIGLRPDQIGRLFGKYVQADATVARQFGGTGLGLSICKRIVEQLGGQIGATSTPGQGSTFSFQLTLKRASTVAPPKHAEEDQSDHLRASMAKLGRPARILVADDNTTNQFVVKKMIDAFRTSIHTAANGIEAVTGTVEFAPDLILMDMRMPEMDGVEATRRIRALGGRFATVPIIALTANAYREDIDACLEAGMTDFLSKPVRKNLLIGAMARALDTLPAPTPAIATGPHDGHQTAYLDQDVCDQLSEAIGRDKMQEAMASFLTEARGRLEALRSLSIESDHTALAREASAVRDLAGTFGFARLSDIAAWLEDNITDVRPDRYADVLSQMDDALEQARLLASRSLTIAA